MKTKIEEIFLIYIDEKYIVKIILDYKQQLEKNKKKKKKKIKKNNKKRKMSERRILRLHHINIKLNLFR
jgi:hypothetical protein